MPKKLTKTFTEPKIYRPKKRGEKPFVFIRFYHAGIWHPIKRRPAVEDGSTKKQYEAELLDLRDALLYKLNSQGWNPVTNSYHSPKADKQVDRLQKLTFSEALDFAYDKKLPDWKPKSASDYKSVKKFLKVGSANTDFAADPVSTYRLAHFKMVMDETRAKRKLSAKSWNKYRDYLCTLVGEMVQYGIVELNYIKHIKTLKEEKTKAHRPPTQDERLLIVTRIKEQHRPYYRFLSLIYGCGIRPKEITGLKIKHLHKLESTIRIPQDIGKTGERETTVPHWVMDLLSEMNLHNYNPDWYIFSGKGNMFMPGPNRMSSNMSNYIWRKIVKKGLKLDLNQYGLKKLSGDDLVKLQHREGLNGLLSLAQNQFGHTNTKQTEEYTSEHLNIQHEVVKTMMPVL